MAPKKPRARKRPVPRHTQLTRAKQQEQETIALINKDLEEQVGWLAGVD